jgi:hypothetical protein
MGIDIYARWRNQTDEEMEKQITGFDILKGHVGYLREAYHGDPYATRHFVSEAFKEPECKAAIEANTLRERLPETLKLVRQREQEIYSEADEYQIWKSQKSYVDFYRLCQRKEKETGEPCTIKASY